MTTPIEKALHKLEQQETRFYKGKRTPFSLKIQLLEKIPPKVQSSLEYAFEKAFIMIFNKGTSVIEKSFDKEGREIDFLANDFVLSQKIHKKSIKRLDKTTKISHFLNRASTTTTGIGLGFLGIGLPDIPLFLGFVLKGIYETAISYGYSYTSEEERRYILRLIRISLTRQWEDEDCTLTLDQEIKKTAQCLSQELLLEKFIQGIPLVGAFGGIVNHRVYKDISKFSFIQYKKRYLAEKNQKTRVFP